MAGRFIKLYDKILNWEWYSDINTCRLFIHLLLKANYKDQMFQGEVIRRGQMATSLSALASQTCLSERQIRVSLDKLKMTGEVSSSTRPRCRIITIIHYDEYQSDGRQNVSLMTGKLSASCQAECQPYDKQNVSQNVTKYRNIEDKKDRKTEQIELPLSATRKDDPFVEAGFDAFWKAYPKKVAKQDAHNAWKKLKPDTDLTFEIIAGIARWKNSDQWVRDDGRYIPHPATWLNGRRWEDDVQPAKPQAPVRSSEPVRQVTAQQYEQRNYDDVQKQIEDERAREIEEKLMKKYGRI